MNKQKQQQKNNKIEGEDKNLSPSKLSSQKTKPQQQKLHRKCIACGEFFDRANLIRIMRTESNEIVINPDNKTFGRSAYLCKKTECLDYTIKKNRLPKALKIKIDSNILEKLKIMLN